jgi:hypothetical protein
MAIIALNIRDDPPKALHLIALLYSAMGSLLLPSEIAYFGEFANAYGAKDRNAEALSLHFRQNPVELIQTRIANDELAFAFLRMHDFHVGAKRIGKIVF